MNIELSALDFSNAVNTSVEGVSIPVFLRPQVQAIAEIIKTDDCKDYLTIDRKYIDVRTGLPIGEYKGTATTSERTVHVFFLGDKDTGTEVPNTHVVPASRYEEYTTILAQKVMERGERLADIDRAVNEVAQEVAISAGFILAQRLGERVKKLNVIEETDSGYKSPDRIAEIKAVVDAFRNKITALLLVNKPGLKVKDLKKDMPYFVVRNGIDVIEFRFVNAIKVGDLDVLVDINKQRIPIYPNVKIFTYSDFNQTKNSIAKFVASSFPILAMSLRLRYVKSLLGN